MVVPIEQGRANLVDSFDVIFLQCSSSQYYDMQVCFVCYAKCSICNMQFPLVFRLSVSISQVLCLTVSLGKTFISYKFR